MRTITYLDRQILFFLNHLGPDGMAREMVIRLVATGVMFALAGIVIYLALNKPDGRQVFARAFFSLLLAVVAGKILGRVVGGDRPYALFPQEVRHVELIVRPASFPSIHAVAAFGLTGGVLFGRYRGWGALMLALGLCMITARVAAGVHWPSDVVGGGLLALAIAALFVAIQSRYWPRLGLRREQGAGLGGDAET